MAQLRRTLLHVRDDEVQEAGLDGWGWRERSGSKSGCGEGGCGQRIIWRFSVPPTTVSVGGRSEDNVGQGKRQDGWRRRHHVRGSIVLEYATIACG